MALKKRGLNAVSSIVLLLVSFALMLIGGLGTTYAILDGHDLIAAVFAGIFAGGYGGLWIVLLRKMVEL